MWLGSCEFDSRFRHLQWAVVDGNAEPSTRMEFSEANGVDLERAATRHNTPYTGKIGLRAATSMTGESPCSHWGFASPCPRAFRRH
jgi:hypothetical protein